MQIILELMDLTTVIPKVLLIFPAKNEEETIERVITTAKQSRYSPEIIVVDAFSSDRTVELARKAGGIVIQQDAKTFPAKGIAMKTGLREAIKSKADIILFLDADIKNLTPEWIDNLVDGCTNLRYGERLLPKTTSRCSSNKTYR